MFYYAFTIRCMNFKKHLPTLEDFVFIIKSFKEKYTHADVRYHLEVVQKLNGNHNVHIHGIIFAKKSMVIRQLKSVLPEGYCVTDFGSVRHMRAWNLYITKTNQRQQKKLLSKLINEVFEEEVLGVQQSLRVNVVNPAISERGYESDPIPQQYKYPQFDIRNI